MIRTTELDRDELLYDEARLMDICDQLAEDGMPPNATAIKEAIDTNARLYEIRTAKRYWEGGTPSYRTDDHTWQVCQAVDDGKLAIKDGELVYPDELEQ